MRRAFAVFEVRLRAIEMSVAHTKWGTIDQGYRTYLDASKILNSYNIFRSARRFSPLVWIGGAPRSFSSKVQHPSQTATLRD